MGLQGEVLWVLRNFKNFRSVNFQGRQYVQKKKVHEQPARRARRDSPPVGGRCIV